MNRVFPGTSHYLKRLDKNSKNKHIYFDSHSHIDLLRTNCANGNVNFDLTCSMSHIHGVVCIHFILRKYFIHGKRPIQIMKQFIIRLQHPKSQHTYTHTKLNGRCERSIISIRHQFLAFTSNLSTFWMAIKN